MTAPSSNSNQQLPETDRSLVSSRSFTRLESPNSSIHTPRSRSATASSAILPDSSIFGTFSDTNISYESPEDLEMRQSDRTELRPDIQGDIPDVVIQPNLPIEILGMTDSFIESLSAKVHPAPVSIESLGTMFQSFYDATAAAISTYVSKIYVSHDSQGSNQPLVSMSEIVQRKRDRRKRDVHRTMLQEMVEKRVTEAVFDKIWRPYSAEDEARDDALRSKTMALGVVGVGLRELGLEENINVMDLQPVCEALQDLNSPKCPHDKLKVLKGAHKAIVDVLTKLVPSTASSADHILPILIYALIISPPGIHIISNLLYIQRFRYQKAIDGEAAYCLTNLEAAISFLETVDMGTLGTDEPNTKSGGDDGQSKNLPSFPQAHTDAIRLNPASSKIPEYTSALPVIETTSANASPQLTTGTIKGHTSLSNASEPTRRISYLTPVEFATSAATSAVNTADQSLKTIGNSLESSYKFLFGKLSDKRTELPKTLEDVRKLVGTPSQEGQIMSDERSHNTGTHVDPPFSTELDVKSGGRGNNSRNMNASATDNSMRLSTSSEGVMPSQYLPDPQQNNTGLTYTPVADSVRNLGNQLGRFAGNINVIRTFSRSQLTKTPPPGHAVVDAEPVNSLIHRVSHDGLSVDPPIQKFLTTDAADLKLGDIDLLVQDYRRLANMLKNAGAF
ncbi:hypothetical protein H072_5704 [Dactylellina haptotyla CBS 200.50]|uniref:VPS9 domain-containing protein n=1 Tax=Dactylellina haptotyla (strain CBS 200.50) TaxID=1284197 RepID=S8BLY1_DACHA|nr:hypothetical protein H072_5704 [Dactylellina haptotyla CBS 200.50]